MTKPKILYLITQSEWGGAQRYIFDLANNLKNDYEITVTAGGEDELLKEINEIGVRTFPLKNLVREISPAKDILAYFEIKKLAKLIKPDILHLNSSKAGVLGAFAGKHAGVKKIIYTVHGFSFNEPMAKWKKYLYLLAEKLSAKYKDKIICVSEFDRQTGIKNKIGDQKKLITIHNGVGQIELLDKNQARQLLNLPPDKIVIGTIANFYPTKGLNYLISAANEVIKNYPNILFRLIGFGQLENELRQQIKKLNLENNFFIGKLLAGNRYLLAFDYYVLPSVKEGFPYAILEAMQTGLPIIATNVGGIPEIIKDGQNGLLVNPADPKSITNAIDYLMKNQGAADRLAKQAKIDVVKNFSLEKMLIETKRVYKN